jgi:hypothetical protein
MSKKPHREGPRFTAQDVTVHRVDRFERFVKAYDEENPLRTADFHDLHCTCTRCLIDMLRSQVDLREPSDPTYDEMYILIGNVIERTASSGRLDVEELASELTTMVQASYDPDCLPAELLALRAPGTPNHKRRR